MTTYRWTLPILAEMKRSNGTRFVTLVNRLGASRDSISRTLEHLLAIGLVERNPGYGHPMRPEYILTAEGEQRGEAAIALMETAGSAASALGEKWSLPVLVAIADGRSRFNDLKGALFPVTARALTLTLRTLLDAGWVERRVEDTFPVGISYVVAQTGQRVGEEAKKLR